MSLTQQAVQDFIFPGPPKGDIDKATESINFYHLQHRLQLRQRISTATANPLRLRPFQVLL